MAVDRDPLDDLLGSISDGLDVDWDHTLRRIPLGSQFQAENLHDVARIANFHRGLQRVGSDGKSEPARWGELLILEQVGAGGQAEVLRAWDPHLRREVALKLLHPESRGADAGTTGSPLLEEGRAAARIRHPHVVTVYGIGQHEGRVGLWMELLSGRTLEQEVRARGPLPVGEAVRMGREIGSALAAVHGARLLHRDLKPANVVRDGEGRFVLADFGLGARSDALKEPWMWATGTPTYMAPELLAGSPPTIVTDVYSWGMLLWFALAGRHPFQAKTLPELCAVAPVGPRPRLREVRPEVPVALAQCIERAIAPRPEERFADAHRMLAALDAVSSAPTRRRARWGVAAAFAGVALAAVLVVSLMRTGAVVSYDVTATFLKREPGAAIALQNGDRVAPGDHLSLQVQVSQPSWVYVLNEDEAGAQFLLYPGPVYDLGNPVPANTAVVLPGKTDGRETAWTVTTVGGREHFLVVVSPEAVPELEEEVGRLPSPQSGASVQPVSTRVVEQLRGTGGLTQLPTSTAPAAGQDLLDRYRALAGQGTGVRGIWVRQFVLENDG